MEKGVTYDEMEETPCFEDVTHEDLYRISEGHGCKDGTKRIESTWKNDQLEVKLLHREQRRDRDNHVAPVQPLPPTFPMPLPMNLMLPEENKESEWKKNNWNDSNGGGWWGKKIDDTEGESGDGNWRTKYWDQQKDEDKSWNGNWNDQKWENEDQKKEWNQGWKQDEDQENKWKEQEWSQNGWKTGERMTGMNGIAARPTRLRTFRKP